MIDYLQFYPTPPDLAAAAPGTGSRGDWYRERPPIDCIEIDITRHARLREAGYPVVGLDFLQFGQRLTCPAGGRSIESRKWEHQTCLGMIARHPLPPRS